MRAFVDRLLAAMFGPVLPDTHAWAVSRLDVWDGKGNHTTTTRKA